MAAELGKVPNHISVEGHTDAKPFAGKGNYSNWELSSDRANAARRLMQQTGLRSEQISQGRGFADQRLRNPKDALDPSNRRVSIVVQYIDTNADEITPASETGKVTKEEKSSASAKPQSEAGGKEKEGE